MKLYDIIIVGAGAAGLMTAIIAARKGLGVLLLDGKEHIGAKILMSGGTRCNVTNQRVTEDDFESENPRAVRNILQAFPSDKAVEFFSDLGVELLLEPGGKYFPVTHSAKTVLDALTMEAARLGVILQSSKKVNEIRSEQGHFHVCGKDFSHEGKTVVLATGGLSHPTTGSDGTGYGIALSLGHHLVKTTPALTPLLTEDKDWKSLAGVSFPARLTLWVDGRKEISFEGGFLFTHFGFSGPTALNISRHWIHWNNARAQVKLASNFLPGESEERLREKLMDTSSRKTIKNFLSDVLPERFAEIFLKKLEVPESQIMPQLRREDRENLIRCLFHFPLEISGVFGYQKAEVTAGGINLSEIDIKTMESKIQPGLFLAGEILDADGRIGGFNFQWSWSTGFLAGQGIAKKIGVQ